MNDWKTKIFGREDAYNIFISAMKQTEAEGELPAVISMEEIGETTLEDIRHLLQETRKDTKLDAEATFYLCDKCDNLHMMLIVDTPLSDQGPRLRVIKGRK